MLRDIRVRLALDYRVMSGLSGPMIRRVRGFVSPLERFAGREASRAEGEAGRVTQYLVEVTRPMLAAPGTALHESEILLDASTPGSAYPFADPVVSIVRRPVPFAHRVHPQSGIVCIGAVWRAARGRMLLAHLLVHTLRLLGFDEPPNGDAGLNPPAHRHWRDQLGGRPLPCSLPYPVLPEDVTHARPPGASPVFIAAAAGGVTTTPSASVFRARSERREPATTVFRPSGSRA